MRIIGIGTDLVEVDRIRVAIGRTPGFVSRVFTESEQAYATAHRDPAERFAARWAAKEAVAKALGTGVSGFGLLDLEIVREHNGRPRVEFSGRAREHVNALGVDLVELSVTHTGALAGAIAVAIGFDDEPSTVEG